ncbi:MAG: hypothetical protein EOP09_10260, partial [Proteobacteria bacterium]
MEWWRIEWVDKWRQLGGDPTTTFEELFFNSKQAGQVSIQWLRFCGFIHLTHSTGIHWWSIKSGWDRITIKISDLFGFKPRAIGWFRISGFTALVCFSALLVGMKPGFFRPFILMSGRSLSRRFGAEPARLAVLFTFLGVEYFLISRGTLHGGIHYAAALLGAWVGAERSQTQGESWLKSHFTISLYSWISCLPFEIIDGRINPLTPILSLISVPLFAGLVFPLGVISLLSEAIFGYGLELFAWVSVILNAGLVTVSGWITAVGVIHAPTGVRVVLALTIGALGWSFYQTRRRPPSMTCTEPV